MSSQARMAGFDGMLFIAKHRLYFAQHTPAQCIVGLFAKMLFQNGAGGEKICPRIVRG
jgi:hypothetical protein